uniref:Uncharacterized protein n=1 Tax=Anas platyrhynchos platyrhynchos TaxID=8840 RepID=A0A493TIN9_ANAPP
MIRTPLPRGLRSITTYPLHALQRTFLLSCSLVYELQHQDTYLSGCIISSPLLLPLRLLL